MKYEYHFMIQRRHGKDRTSKEVSEEEFLEVLAVEYCGRVTECGLIGILTPDKGKAKKLIRSMKRSNVDLRILQGHNATLFFRKKEIRDVK